MTRGALAPRLVVEAVVAPHDPLPGGRALVLYCPPCLSVVYPWHSITSNRTLFDVIKTYNKLIK